MNNVVYLDEYRKNYTKYLAEAENDLLESLSLYISEKDESQGLSFKLKYEMIKNMTIEDLM